MNSIICELIRLAIGKQEGISKIPSEAEWYELFDMAEKQSLVGICFVGLQRLGADADDGFAKIGMCEELYLEWMGMAAQINMKNEQVNRQCVAAQQMFEAAGFRTFIMKGQGNAVLYKSFHSYDETPDVLPLFRQSGDIDVYLEGGFEKVNDFVQRTCPTKEINELEIHYRCFGDTDVEIHYRPFIMRNPIKNARLQRFFTETMCFDHKVVLPNGAGYLKVPSLSFNLVHQIVHIYHHLFTEGVGLRQLMDYYFVLSDASELPCSEFQKVKDVVSDLRLDRFASALMWVMEYVFGLSRDSMLLEPNEKDGKFLLGEIMLSGNFGKQDERQRGMYASKWNSFWIVNEKTLYLARFDRWMWFWGPLWRLYHFAWRKIKGFK